MHEKLKQVNWIYVALILLGLRALIDANLSQALIVACLSGLQGFKEWQDTKKTIPLNDQVLKELEEMKNNVNGLAIRGVKTAVAQEPRRFF